MEIHRQIKYVYPGLENEGMSMNILMGLPIELSTLITPQSATNMQILGFVAKRAQFITEPKNMEPVPDVIKEVETRGEGNKTTERKEHLLKKKNILRMSKYR